MFAALVSWCSSSALVWFVWPRGDSLRAGRWHDALGAAGQRWRQQRRRATTSGVIVPGQNPIEHVVFLVKENRSFDHYFGRYPGVDGATEGGTMDCSTLDDAGTRAAHGGAAGAIPHDLGHAFYPGLLSINGGKMNGFNCIALGEDLTGYSQYDRDSLPAYWAYADRFVIADHFFTSMYGPTFPEHLYTVAAQSYGIVDNKSTTDTEGNYCDDPLSTRSASRSRTSPRPTSSASWRWRRTSRRVAGAAAEDRGVLGADPHVHQHPGAARTSSRQAASAGSTTRNPSSG